jgi:hypothetical protein
MCAARGAHQRRCQQPALKRRSRERRCGPPLSLGAVWFVVALALLALAAGATSPGCSDEARGPGAFLMCTQYRRSGTSVRQSRGLPR